VLINRAVERARLLRLPEILLRRRGEAAARAPLVVVPGMFGTRLRDRFGRFLWGTTARLYRGPPLGTAEGVTSDGIVEGMTLLPGVAHADVHGGLLRFLEAAGGYRRGEDLVTVDYDWRAGSAAGVEALAETIHRLRGASDERVDVFAVSTGGQVVRHYLAGAAHTVRRTIYLAAPQRGTFDALACVHRGFRFAPGGKLFPGEEAALAQTVLDALPHQDDPVFVDEQGTPVPLDLYDERTWHETSLLPKPVAGLQQRLERARAAHRALDGALPHDAFVIGARHRPTPARAVLVRGKARVPPPVPRSDDPFLPFSYAPGDGDLPAASLRAIPGLDDRRLWWVETAVHARLPAHPFVHRLVLEGLLATDRHIPATTLRNSC
jgi:hypothetical protein